MKYRFTAWALALAMGIAGMPGSANAQNYPNQDIRLICAFPAGSGADVLVRYFAEKLRPIANQTVIVENKVGAGGHIATEFVAANT
jgi:tripartite-type tricarboxylate transporter receptor subunit TctC